MNAALMEKVQAVATPTAIEAIQASSQMVDSRLQQEAASEVELVEDACRLTMSGGGKRLRPLMLTCSALAVDPQSDLSRLAALGACVEMIHMATLIHDDVIDGAATRRGKPTAYQIHGPTASILSGDVLLSKAMRVLALDGDLSIIRLISESVVEMAEGEVREVEVRTDFDLTEAEHLRILTMKTAAFIEASCRAGARAGGANQEQEDALGTYGRSIGLAFQIADDLLDFRGIQAKTGKPWATDFREGCATLPLIALRESLTEEETLFVRRKFGDGAPDDELAMICQWMEARGAFSYAEEKAKAYVAEALQSLEILPESPYRSLLEMVSAYVVTREA
jgi:octaprenyl-diphosphate synthase